MTMNREQSIQQAIQQELNVLFLSVVNESSQHSVPANSETHFKVTVVSDDFTSVTRINRHKLLNTLLASEFNTGLHALSMHLFTPEEWQQRGGDVQNSPACRGGSRHG